MTKTWKWIVGITVGLVVLAIGAGVAFMAMNHGALMHYGLVGRGVVRQTEGFGWTMMSSPVCHMQFMHEGHGMRMGGGFGMFGLVGGFFRGVFGIGLFALFGYIFYQWGKNSAGSKAPAAPASDAGKTSGS